MKIEEEGKVLIRFVESDQIFKGALTGTQKQNQGENGSVEKDSVKKITIKRDETSSEWGFKRRDRYLSKPFNRNGCVIHDVTPDSVCAKAGLQQYIPCLIRTCGGNAVSDTADFDEKLREMNQDNGLLEITVEVVPLQSVFANDFQNLAKCLLAEQWISAEDFSKCFEIVPYAGTTVKFKKEMATLRRDGREIHVTIPKDAKGVISVVEERNSDHKARARILLNEKVEGFREWCIEDFHENLEVVHLLQPGDKMEVIKDFMSDSPREHLLKRGQQGIINKIHNGWARIYFPFKDGQRYQWVRPEKLKKKMKKISSSRRPFAQLEAGDKVVVTESFDARPKDRSQFDPAFCLLKTGFVGYVEKVPKDATSATIYFPSDQSYVEVDRLDCLEVVPVPPEEQEAPQLKGIHIILLTIKINYCRLVN